mgnify:CR=1 FL=1
MASVRTQSRRRRQSITVIALLAAILLTILAIAGVLYGMLTRPRTPAWQALGPASTLLAAEPQRAEAEAQIVYVTKGADGPLVLNARDPYRGCVVAWVTAEQHFVDPCYGSRYTADGAYLSGPSPRSLDRFAAQVNNGTVELNLNQPIPGQNHP